MILQKVILSLLAISAICLNACLPLQANETTAGTKIMEENNASKKQLVEDIYANLKDLGETFDPASLGLARVNVGTTTDYTFGGKPLKELDEDMLNNLDIETGLLLNEGDFAENMDQREAASTRKDTEQMLELMRTVKEEQDRRKDAQDGRR